MATSILFKAIAEWVDARRALKARREFELGYSYAAGHLLCDGYIALIYLSDESDGVHEGTKYADGMNKAMQHFKLPLDERFF
jgi:hypothetical protein